MSSADEGTYQISHYFLEERDAQDQSIQKADIVIPATSWAMDPSTADHTSSAQNHPLLIPALLLRNLSHLTAPALVLKNRPRLAIPALVLRNHPRRDVPCTLQAFLDYLLLNCIL